MNKAVKTAHWFAGWRTPRRTAQDDPADLGTAFGLDLSLRMLDDAAAAPADPRSAPPLRRRWRWRRTPAA